MSLNNIQITPEITNYLNLLDGPEPELLAQLRAETALLPASIMQIGSNQARFMDLLVRLIKPTKCLEVGVFTGMSSLVTALAMPESGKLIACDIKEEFTQMAQKYWQLAGVNQKIQLVLAPAVHTLLQLKKDQEETFDFVFIDADKSNYEIYYFMGLDLLKKGGLMLIDNALWRGDVVNPEGCSQETKAIARLNQHLKTSQSVYSYLLPIGDGIQLIVKK